MREKLNSLPLAELREIAKTNGLKGVSGLKKAELVDRLMVMAEEQKRNEEIAAKAVSKAQTDVKKNDENDAGSKKSDTAARRTTALKKGAEAARKNEASKKGTESAENSKAAAAHTIISKEKSQISSDGRSRSEAADKNAMIKASSRLRAKTPAKPVPVTALNKKSSDTAVADVEAKMDAQFKPEVKTEAITLTEGIKEAEPAERTEEELIERALREAKEEETRLDSGIVAHGILEVLSDGYGFIRSDNYLSGENDVYVSPSQIKKFSLRTGDMLMGKVRIKTQNEKFGALLRLDRVNGVLPIEVEKRRNFEDLTPIFPNERLRLEQVGEKNIAMRVFDLISPIGKGQRGMIVSPPKAGKTTLLKGVAHSIQKNNPEVHILILLIDERPEEVTDIRESIVGENVEVIYSTFDELPEHHKRVSEMVIERAKRLVEMGRDVIILLDSITRLARAYNLLVPPSGRTLSGGLDPAALHMPKRFFGAARNIREGGSLTILATALVDTGSKMDDVVYEEFKGTGNMELILDRKLQEKRVFPAIDIAKSGTRRDDLLLRPEEQEAAYIIHKATGGLKAEEATEKILDLFVRTRTNSEFIEKIRGNKYF